MAKPFQFLLLAVGVIALFAVGGEIIYSMSALAEALVTGGGNWT